MSLSSAHLMPQHTLPFSVVLLCVILQGWIYKEGNKMRDLNNSFQQLTRRLQDPQTKQEAVKQKKQELQASLNERTELQQDTRHHDKDTTQYTCIGALRISTGSQKGTARGD